MGKITQVKNGIMYERRDEVTLIEAYGPNCLRYRSTRNGKLSDERWTLLEPLPVNQVCVEGDASQATITNGDLSATITDGSGWDTCKVVYYRRGKMILSTREEGDPVTRFTHLSGDDYKIKAIFDSNQGEHIYGLGQEQEDQFDRKGCTCNILHYNTKSTLPVIYSSLGYGFLWNNPSPGYCETTRNHTLWCSENAYQIDYLIFTGDKPAEVMRTYSDLCGYAPKFPEWAAGFWQCKLRYESQEDLLEVAREYHKRGVPLAAIVIDYFHWTEQGEWKFDPKYWPDPKAMCEELEALGVIPVVSIWPTINPNSENYTTMDNENMLVRTENGQYGTFNFYGQQTFIDVTNPKTGPFLWEKIKENYYKYGIKTFWLDEAEPEVHPQQFSNLRFYAGNGAQTALLYPYYFSKIFYEGLKSEGEDEIVVLTRAAYPGSQKYGAIVWNGDIPSTFKALRQSVTSGLSMSMSGIPWWNSDIGGFHSGDIESDYFKELIVRWFQFGLFSPVMRLHGARNRTSNQIDRHPGVKERSGGDNEIWSFGEANYPILRNLILLRERLRPYIMKYMNISSENGSPIMRPMFYDFYEDENCYSLEDQYMFGEDILFAPILEFGEVEREVYLPQGTWVNINDRITYEGGKTVSVRAEIHQFIAFIKSESDVLRAFEYTLHR